MLGRPDHRPPAGGRREPSPAGLSERRPGSSELLATIFSRARGGATTAAATGPLPAAPGPAADRARTTPPPPPRSLADTGLTLGQLADLVLKATYLHGCLSGADLAHQLRLPFRVVEEALAFLRHARCLEVHGGETPAEFANRYQLTEEGRVRAREAFEQCRYVGPAPVSLRGYVEQCRRQSVAGLTCRPDDLQSAFSDLLLRPGLLDELGPAVCDGQAILLYGPSGNGKTCLARRIGRYFHTAAGEIYVPYAVLVDGATITVFDPNVHQTTDDRDEATTASAGHPGAEVDLRWRRVRRPVVVTAGELTLDMLDLRRHADSCLYVAPLQLKANGGVFVIDDLGRQQATPRELLNRWILPLAERIDYLTLSTGKKFAVPFEPLVVFSTNLNLADLADDAFLRRIRHKLWIGPPTAEEFSALLERCCRERGLPLDPDAGRSLFASRYSSSRPPRWSDPQDLMQVALSICRFRGEEPRLTPGLLAQAADRFLGPAGEPDGLSDATN